MKTTNYLLVAALGVAAMAVPASCINDTAATYQPDELRLRSGLEVASATRSTANGYVTQFDANDQVDVFIKEKDPAVGRETVYGQPELTTVQADRSSMKFAAVQYWPKSGHSVYIYAWYPKGAVGTDLGVTDRTFSVPADQSGSIKAADLMWGVPSGGVTNPVEKQTSAVLLQFRHRLSKLKVVLVPDGAKGMTVSDLRNATVSIGGIKTTVTITDLKAGTVVTKVAPTADLTVMSGSTELTGYAILPAQDLGGLTMTVTLESGASLNWVFPTGDSKYVTVQERVNTYTLTVGRAELKVEGAITDWLPNTGDSHELTI